MRKEQEVFFQIDCALDCFLEQTILAIDEFWSIEDKENRIM